MTTIEQAIDPLTAAYNQGYDLGRETAATEAGLMLKQHADRLRALLAEREWQPIETAPKDGTEVLLWIDDDEESPRKGHWEPRLSLNRPHKWSVAYGWCEDKPTHWMPLPAPPRKDS